MPLGEGKTYFLAPYNASREPDQTLTTRMTSLLTVFGLRRNETYSREGKTYRRFFIYYGNSVCPPPEEEVNK